MMSTEESASPCTSSAVTDAAIIGCTPDIVKYVDFRSLAPHLFAEQQLTISEFQEVLEELTPRITRATKLLQVLQTKGPKWPQQFVDCLAKATEHTGHEHLLQQLHAKSGTSRHGSMSHGESSSSTVLPHQFRACRTSEFAELKSAIQDLETKVVTEIKTAELNICKHCGLKQQIEDLQHQNEQLQAKLNTKDEDLKKMDLQLQNAKQLLSSLKEEGPQIAKQLSKGELEFRWTTSLPQKVAGGSLRVHLSEDGTRVYVCGGDVNKYTPNIYVDIFDLMRRKWREQRIKAPVDLVFFGSAIVKGRLVIIGGRNVQTEKHIETLSVLNEDKSPHWSESPDDLPPMPTARRTTCAVADNDRLVVAGGYGANDQPLDVVEVLYLDTKQWKTAVSLPIPLAAASGVLCNGQAYILGGVSMATSQREWVDVAFRCPIDQLTSTTAGNDASNSGWEQIKNMPYRGVSAVMFDEHILVIGGENEDEATTPPSNGVYRYSQEKDIWVKIPGKMPTHRYNCSDIVLPNYQLMVVGGRTEPANVNSACDAVEVATLCYRTLLH